MFRTVSQSARFVAPRLARGYAEASSSNNSLKLSFALPYKALFENKEVTQVNLPTTAGNIGVLANHVPTVEELIPGVVEVIEGSETKQYFVAGGFASISPESVLNLNAVDAYPLEDFSASEVKTLLANAQKNLTSSDEGAATQAKIEVEVLEALAAVAK